MAIIRYTPVEHHDIAAELASRGYSKAADHAPPPGIHIPPAAHAPPVRISPAPHAPSVHIPPAAPHAPPADHVAPIIHLPGPVPTPPADIYPHPGVHAPPEIHLPPGIHAPEIHIPAEAVMEPTGWRKYLRWLPYLILLAPERDVLELVD